MPVHHLMVGTWTPPGAIFTFAFDDEALTLKLVHRTAIPEDEPISWMTFDVCPTPNSRLPLTITARQEEYLRRCHEKMVQLYRQISNVDSPLCVSSHASRPYVNISLASRLTFAAAAASSETNTRAIFLLAAKKPPYGVYCNPFYNHAGSGTVYAVDANGTLAAPPAQHYPYQSNTGIHGMVFDPTERYLYSADLKANKVWVHRRDDAGDPANLSLVGSVDCPDKRDHPRWVAMHPSGTYLYVLMEKGNRLAECAIDKETKLPIFKDERFWPLIPPGIPEGPRWTMYRADVCALSHSSRYLFASSRANSFDLTGYVAAFKLGDDGAVERQILLNPTPNSGGHSNAVAPSDWTDEWLAITDDQEGWLEIYRWQDEFLARVARVRVPEPGFGMNAIWYD